MTNVRSIRGEIADELRNLADRADRGEVFAVAVAYVSNDASIGTLYCDPNGKSMLMLVAAGTMLHTELIDRLKERKTRVDG